MHIFLVALLTAASLAPTPVAPAATDKIQPLNAVFTVLPGAASGWSDVQVSIRLVIHNSDEGSLLGSKFICHHDIDALSLTDDEGRRIPYTLKSYPRKHIVWEYGPPSDNRRTVNIQFTMRRAVKREHGTGTLEIDWIGGWNRDVYDASYAVVLPGELQESDLLTVAPGRYTRSAAKGQTTLSFVFPELNAKILKVVYKDKTPAAAQQPHVVAPPAAEARQTRHHATPQTEQEASTSSAPPKGSQEQITNVRAGTQGSVRDRIVFDLTRRIPYDLVHADDAGEIEIAWRNPVTVVGKALSKKKIAAARIAGIRWKQTPERKTSCIITLSQKEVSVKHGFLDNPPRLFIDIADAAPPAAPVISRAAAPQDNATTVQQALAQEPPASLPQPGDNAVVQDPTPTFVPPPPAPTTALPMPPEDVRAADKADSIEEKLAYQKAKKLLEVAEYANAVAAYEKLLSRYPDTKLQEQILYDIADAQYKLADQREPKNFNSALQAYKKAITHYPESPRAAYAAFCIAECHRKSEFFIEASSQYQLVADRYPTSPYAAESRFWLAECLFQMRKFEDALREFEKFTADFPTGTHAREAAFRIADCYAELKDYERAEFYYEKAMRRWPDLLDLSAGTLNNMAMTNYYKGRFEKSRELMMLSFNVHALQKDRERLLRFAGDSYQWEGDMQKALNLYGLAIDLFPDSEEAAIAVMRMADLGVNVAGLTADHFRFKDFNPYKEPEKAYRWITDHAQAHDTLTEAYYKLGFTLAKQGRLDEAVNFFKKSMSNRESGMYYAKSFENIQKILTRMIHTAVEQEDYFTVVETYKKNESVFLKHMDDCLFFYDVAKSYFETGLLGEAAEMLNVVAAAASNPECSQRADVLLSSIDLARGDIDKARVRLNRLLYSGKPLQIVLADAYHALGDAYYLDRQYAMALEAYSSATKGREPASYRDIKTMVRMAEAFGKNGYYYNGIHLLKNALAAIERFKDPLKKEVAELRDDAALMIGDFYVGKGDAAAAAAVYGDITRRAAGDNARAWAYVKWGEALMRMGSFDNATRVLQQFTQRMPDSFLGDVARAHLNSIQWSQRHQAELSKGFL